jgi:hypothetical protein
VIALRASSPWGRFLTRRSNFNGAATFVFPLLRRFVQEFPGVSQKIFASRGK